MPRWVKNEQGKNIKLTRDPELIQALKFNILKTMDWATFKADLDSITDLSDKWFAYMLYWSGGRPTEVLNLKSEDIEMEKGIVYISFYTLKGGVPRRLPFSPRLPLMKDFFEWSKIHFRTYIFQQLRTRAGKPHIVKWKVPGPDGQLIIRQKQYPRFDSKIYHRIYKYFKHTPYYFRHNRFTKMRAGNKAKKQPKADLDVLKYWKGAKRISSVEVYTHWAGEDMDVMKYVKP